MLVCTGLITRGDHYFKVCRICKQEKLLRNFPFRKINERRIFEGRDKRTLDQLRGPEVSNQCKKCITEKISARTENKA